MTQPLSFRWDPEFIARIDGARGDVPRSAWVRRAVELRVALHNVTNEEIDRLLDDWRAAVKNRNADEIDRGIAAKLAMQEDDDGS